ncbi:MAG: DUF5655 domain-containing protein [Acidobacteriota bacterium]|nr:DUF5655 domain-containing protein [Acidobacteriota bacterium]
MRTASRNRSRPALWTCAKCGRPFANRNQSHSCGRYTVKEFLKGKSKQSIELYNCFVQAVRECGKIIVAPAKTRVGFQVRMIFAAVNKLSERGLDAHVVLARRLEHPRFSRIESISPKNHVHHFHVSEGHEIDADVREWLKEAYSVGKQDHLK